MTTIIEQTVIIVGAGTSGLATSACLNQSSIPNILLEKEDCFASLWKKYAYDRLELHLRKAFCELPHMPFPSTYPEYVTREQFIEYLDDYVSNFEINVACNRSVEFSRFDESEGKWEVKVKNLESGEIEEYVCRFLVVATGENEGAFVPKIEGLESYGGEIVHSTQYKNGEKFKGKSALVVGSGNSAMEIALDLATYNAHTSMVVRSPLHIISREMMHYGVVMAQYVPLKVVEYLVVLLSKLVYGDLTKYGIKRPEEGPFTMRIKYGKFPVTDTGTCRKIRSGEIQVLPAVKSIRGKEVEFENGKTYAFDVIVFATGFNKSQNKWLQGDELAKLHFPNHWKGKNGVYTAGLGGRGFFGAGMDAKNIANDIKTLM